jgi:hypothetical protein
MRALGIAAVLVLAFGGGELGPAHAETAAPAEQAKGASGGESSEGPDFDEAPSLPDDPPDRPPTAPRRAPAPPAAAVVPPAGAVAPPAASKKPAVRKILRLRRSSLIHKYQLGLALLPATGFRVIFPYETNVSCGEQGKRVCTGLLPFFLDFQTSFGFAEHWDVLVDLRFGIESDFTRSRQFAIAPGVRYWVDPDLPVKFFATIQGVFDGTPQNSSAVPDNDFGFRNANGVMIEVMRNFGFYAQFGETIGFRRWLRFEIDGGVGIQARIP